MTYPEMTEAEFEASIRCEHDKIILSCLEVPCPKKDAYIAESQRRLAEWEARGEREARNYIREMFGLEAD